MRVKETHDAEWGNRLRWQKDRHGHYEVYYLTFNHFRTRTGYWIRYTLTAPENGREACAQMWFSFFDYSSPENNFGIRQTFPIESLSAESGPFALRIGDNELSSGHASGRIKGLGHDAAWNLNFTPPAAVHHLLPKMLYNVKLADTLAICPDVAAHFSGTVRVDGRTLEFKREPGCQTHLWGEKHAQRWAWAHCSAFAEDPSAVFEGLSVQIRRAGVTLPPVNLLAIRFRDTWYPFTELAGALHCGGSFELGLWKFRARAGSIMFKGEISCRDADMVCAEYLDPDGEHAWCHNSEAGCSNIRVFRRAHPLATWKHSETLTSLATTHVEFAGRKPDPRVRHKIEEIP